MHSLEFLQDLAAVMVVAGLVTILFHRFKQPVVRTFIGRYRSVICAFLFLPRPSTTSIATEMS